MITLYTPKFEDLWFRQSLLADPQTMSYNEKWGGTISFPRERWDSWYRRWVAEPEGKRFYRYLLREDGTFAGEVACHLDEDRSLWLADVIVKAQFRGKGCGRAGLDLLCDAARELGIDCLYDEIASDNPSVSLFLKNGFTEVCRTEETVTVKKIL